jgi:endogenous inhibitor of DNA gyrase (YacG/DUF329 family)
MAKLPRSLRCPTCKKTVKADNPDFPFCSERCRLLDLGKWASGGYVVSSPVTDTADDAPEIRNPQVGDDED